MRTTIQGLPGMLKRFRTLDFVAGPARNFLRDWSGDLQKEAQKNISVFRGDAKASIDTRMDNSFFPKWAEVFSDNPVTGWLQYGTGSLSEDPRSAHTPYRPPVDALRDWSQSKGLDPFSVVQGIYAKGGTPPTHFFSDASFTVSQRMSGSLARFGGNIEFDAGRYP